MCGGAHSQIKNHKSQVHSWILDASGMTCTAAISSPQTIIRGRTPRHCERPEVYRAQQSAVVGCDFIAHPSSITVQTCHSDECREYRGTTKNLHRTGEKQILGPPGGGLYADKHFGIQVSMLAATRRLVSDIRLHSPPTLSLPSLCTWGRVGRGYTCVGDEAQCGNTNRKCRVVIFLFSKEWGGDGWNFGGEGLGAGNFVSLMCESVLDLFPYIHTIVCTGRYRT